MAIASAYEKTELSKGEGLYTEAHGDNPYLIVAVPRMHAGGKE